MIIIAVDIISITSASRETIKLSGAKYNDWYMHSGIKRTPREKAGGFPSLLREAQS